MKTNEPKLMQKCEGRWCDAREKCYRFLIESHPAQPPIADYSQVAEFKRANPAESCRMFQSIPIRKEK